MNYHVTSDIWLSLEPYHNRGLKPERTCEIISGIPDPGSSRLNLRCRPAGINNNCIVQTDVRSPEGIADIVSMIAYRLDDELNRLNK